MQRRTYADFRNSDCGNTFAEYMGINAPEFHWDSYRGGWVMRRFDRVGATIQGQAKPTKKEAKASYKEALARHYASQPKRPAYGCQFCYPDKHCPADCVARNRTPDE